MAAAWTPAHGHPVPYHLEDHIRANLDLAQRVHAKYPKVLIEMHDTIAGGSTARITPVYYKYGLPGSYDENWGFELMWDPLADLKETPRPVALLLQHGLQRPDLPAHQPATRTTKAAWCLWWYASTCRHLGIGGTSPKPAVVEAQQQAMRRYRQLDRFYKRGEFYGINEEIHLHVLPKENAFVVNVFNLSDQPRSIQGESTSPASAWTRSAATPVRMRSGRCRMAATFWPSNCRRGRPSWPISSPPPPETNAAPIPPPANPSTRAQHGTGIPFRPLAHSPAA